MPRFIGTNRFLVQKLKLHVFVDPSKNYYAVARWPKVRQKLIRRKTHLAQWGGQAMAHMGAPVRLRVLADRFYSF